LHRRSPGSRRALGKPTVWLHSALTPRALQAAGQEALLPPHRPNSEQKCF